GLDPLPARPGQPRAAIALSPSAVRWHGPDGLASASTGVSRRRLGVLAVLENSSPLFQPSGIARGADAPGLSPCYRRSAGPACPPPPPPSRARPRPPPAPPPPC